jgi:hypothetical protein
MKLNRACSIYNHPINVPNMKKFLISTIMAVLLCRIVSAQTIARSIVSSSGGEGSTASTAINWTLGELAIQHYCGSTVCLSQGFHQPSLLIIAFDQSDLGNDAIAVFPNPTHEELYLSAGFNPQSQIRYQLFDANGKEVIRSYIHSDLTVIDFRSVAVGPYFLTVTVDGGSLHQFKIMKQ